MKTTYKSLLLEKTK